MYQINSEWMEGVNDLLIERLKNQLNIQELTSSKNGREIK